MGWTIEPSQRLESHGYRHVQRLPRTAKRALLQSHNALVMRMAYISYLTTQSNMVLVPAKDGEPDYGEWECLLVIMESCRTEFTNSKIHKLMIFLPHSTWAGLFVSIQ